MASESAVLMNKHTPILEITIDGSKVMDTGSVLNIDMMPIQLQDTFTIAAVQKWFSDRLLSDKREGIEEARKLFRGFETEKYFFSLSDQYWVRYTQNDTWEKYNFFTNEYSKEVGKIFFEPWNVDVRDLKRPSPDRTTNGVLKKRWVQDPETKRSYLVKQGSALYHQEPLSEVMASLMLKKLNILPFVGYDLVIDGLRFCSKCPNFVTADTEFVPAIALYNKKPRRQGVSEYDHMLDMCREYSIVGAKDFLDKMIVADHIICNNDRHFGNFGFLRSAENGKFLGFAPLFDCGSAYWGTSRKVEQKKSRYFSGQEMAVLGNAAKKGMLKNARASKAMITVLQSYPDITDKKKAAIKKMIDEIDRELEQMEGTIVNSIDRTEKDKKRGGSHTRHDEPLVIDFP